MKAAGGAEDGGSSASWKDRVAVTGTRGGGRGHHPSHEGQSSGSDSACLFMPPVPHSLQKQSRVLLLFMPESAVRTTGTISVFILCSCFVFSFILHLFSYT